MSCRKMPREYADKIIKLVPAHVNVLLDEMECPKELRAIVKDHVYSQLSIQWLKSQGRK